ncbi:MAG: MFS transporter [Patulibacter sp.]
MSTVDRHGRERASRRAWAIWAIAASAYLIALLHRMALGVAGTDAAVRFDIPVGSLAAFTALQLLLYLVMQVPAGLLADRVGPRRTLALGLALMAAGELLFAFATSMPVGLVGRGLVGIGDALTFLNVLRLVHAWFPHRQQTLMVALTGFAGALGQLVSTVPLELSLQHLGWVPTFLLIGGVTGLLVALPLTFVRDRPAHVPTPTAGSHDSIRRTLAAAWKRPGTRHGFFVHMATLAPFLLATAVWGVPFMEGTQGLDRDAAAGYLLLGALGFLISGPILGLLVGAHPMRLRWASVLGPLCNVVAWGTLTLWPDGTVPRPLLGAALVLSGIGAAATMFAFEVARRESPPVASASAAALVNCGGFSGAVVGAVAIGLLLNRVDAPAGSTELAIATQHALLPSLVIAVASTIGCAWYARRPSIPWTAEVEPVPWESETAVDPGAATTR